MGASRPKSAMRSAAFGSIIQAGYLLTMASASQAQALDDLGTLKVDGTGESYAVALSADGAVVVGRATSDQEINAFDSVWATRAFRWTANGGMTDLGALAASDNSFATAVSADGAVVVGDASGYGFLRAFRWTESGGMVDLGTLRSDNDGSSSVAGVSADGAVVVGSAHTDREGYPYWHSWYSRPFRWTESTGMVDLGTLRSKDSRGNSYASGVSADGSVVIGSAVTDEVAIGSQALVRRAFRWTESTGMVDLGTLRSEKSGWSSATAVNADGTVVVGSAETDEMKEGYLENQLSKYKSHAFRWTESHGMVDLGTLRSDNLGSSSATDVSADGEVVVGSAENDAGEQRAFIWRASDGPSNPPLDHVNLVSQILGSARDAAANSMILQWDLVSLVGRELSVANSGIRVPVSKALQDDGRAIRRPMAVRLDADYAGNGRTGDTIYTGGTLAVGLDNGITVGGSLHLGRGAPDYGGLAYDGDLRAVSAYVRKRSPDATGLTWKLAAGYSRLEADATRRATLANTEEGIGRTEIDNAVALAEVGYGLRRGQALLIPRLTVVHATGTTKGYTESNAIAFTVTYDDYDTEATVATLAADVFIELTSESILELTVGVETDLYRSDDPVTGSSLATANFMVDAPGIVNATRAFASASLRHGFAPGRFLEGRVALRQSPFTNALTQSAGLSYVLEF